MASDDSSNEALGKASSRNELNGIAEKKCMSQRYRSRYRSETLSI